MPTKKNTTTNLHQQLADARLKFAQVYLDVKAGKNTNTNAHKPLKKQIAQLLTQINQVK